MDEDRTLFGHGRYPDSGPLAVLARVSFLLVIVGVMVAVFLPPSRVPQLLYSHYLEHFAAFYLVLLSALAAMPRARLRRVATGCILFATALEASHLITDDAFLDLARNWVADLGGLSAAAAPVVLERFRRRFPRHLQPEPEPIENGPKAL